VSIPRAGSIFPPAALGLAIAKEIIERQGGDARYREQDAPWFEADAFVRDATGDIAGRGFFPVGIILKSGVSAPQQDQHHPREECQIKRSSQPMQCDTCHAREPRSFDGRFRLR
jgi:hypothetical protein